MAIENGVGRDMLSSGMVSLREGSAGSETFMLLEDGMRFLLSVLDNDMLVDAGVLEPKLILLGVD